MRPSKRALGLCTRNTEPAFCVHNSQIRPDRGWCLASWVSARTIRDYAITWVAQVRVRTAPADYLPGCNVHALSWRANCFQCRYADRLQAHSGLDFAAVATSRARIMEARTDGVAVLLLSEDSHELLELTDRILVMSDGELVCEAPVGRVDSQMIQEHMAGKHWLVNFGAPPASVGLNSQTRMDKAFMSTALADLAFDLSSLAAAYADGLSPAAVVEEVFERIDALGDPGVFIALRDREAAISEATALGDKPDGGALWGIPFAVKDNIDVAGLPTTAACPDFAYAPDKDAEAVARLRKAGAIVIGKTNLDQFATGLVGLRTPYPVPKNAVDPALAPGGSSSGSAVSVARGLVAFSLGTDTAGSGRVPAGLNNIVGLKPTVGAVPTIGVLPACKTLDCVSVFATSVDDAYQVFTAMAGYCAADPFSRSFRTPSIAALPPSFRVLVPDAASRRFAGDVEAEKAFVATLDDLAALGAKIVEIDLEPFFAVASLLYDGPFVAERYEAIRDFVEASPQALHPVTAKIILGAKRFDAANAFGALYRLAELKRELGGVWASADAMIVPTYPRPRGVAEIEAEPVALNSEFGTYTNFVNLLDLCALAVPGRPRADGMPAGVTLIAPAGHDGRIAAIGEVLHALGGVPVGATGRKPARSPMRTASTAPDEMEIVVVGAHLSGMALNVELTKLGGRFLRAVETQASYKLYALPGAVARPGLLRVAEGEGAAIATEVWALPRSAIGPFVAAIPSPLGFGTLKLADGTTPFGFLVEPEGVVGAKDITEFGGWRAYMGATRAA